MPKGSKASLPLVRWGQQNGLTKSYVNNLASRGFLDPFRPQDSTGKVVRSSGIIDVAGANAWLKQWQQRQKTRDENLKQGSKARRAKAEEERAQRRAQALGQAARPSQGVLERVVPEEDAQMANDRRAQLEADKVELEVNIRRQQLCVREDLLALVTDGWIRLCRQLEAVPRLYCDAAIAAVQGEKRVSREQREAVQKVLEEAVEKELRAAQEAMEEIFRQSGVVK